MKVVVATCIGMILGMHAWAEKPSTCTATQANALSRDIARVQDWNAFYHSFKRVGGCGHGKLSQEYSYALSRLLAHHWGDVSSLLGFAAADKEFKEFVLRHIDEDMPEEESQAILRNSRQHCPADGDWLCKAIVDY
jgi:hypothetical protein